MPIDDSADNITPRDLTILKVRVANPTASTRELSTILDEQYDISLSHNRINEILRVMADDDVFREAIIPNQEIFRYSLFRIAFNYENFDDHWEACYWDLVEDPHVLMFFNADSDYHWQLVMQFRTIHQMGRWIHEFFKTHGRLVSAFHNTMLHRVHKASSRNSSVLTCGRLVKCGSVRDPPGVEYVREKTSLPRQSVRRVGQTRPASARRSPRPGQTPSKVCSVVPWT